MPVQQIVWIALPAHVSEQGTLRLSAYASLRLHENGSGSADNGTLLSSFSEQVQHWADDVAGRAFTVEFDSGTVTQGLAPVEAPDASLWDALFPPDTPVGSWAFTDQSNKPLHTFPVADVLAFLEKLYGETAARTGREPPLIDDPDGPLGSLRPLREIVSRTPEMPSYLEEADGRATPGIDGVVENDYGPAGSPARAFGDAHRFYYRPWYREQVPEDPAQPKPQTVYGPEFHERLALLGDYPELTRRLGLVLTFDLPVQTTALPPSGKVRVYPDGEPGAPWTAYDLDAGQGYFFVRPEAQDPQWMRNGWLVMGDLLQAYQVDVDGAALKLAEFASHVADLSDGDLRGPTTPLQATLPALRTAGWTISQNGKAKALHQKFQSAKSLNTLLDSPPYSAVLHAEQLVRGWRVDVRDEERWRSLHYRDVTHEFAAAGVEPIAYTDEGFAKGATVTSNPHESQPGVPKSEDLYVHEALFGWSGWSLAVPRPGKHLPRDDSETAGNVESYDDGQADFGVATRAQVTDRTLARLRFGRSYAFRARAVDLAGNGHGHDEHLEVDPDLRTPERVYRRFEPVPSPILVPRQAYTEGESLGHLVIRSNGEPGAADDISAKKYAAKLNDVTGQTVYRGTSDRHVLPPKSPAALAESHGIFDALLDGAPPSTLAAMYEVALREAAVIPDGPTPEIEPSHLPDPWATGVRLVAFDHTGAEIGTLSHLFDLDPSSPKASVFRLEVVEGPTFSMASSDARLVRIAVPKAASVRLELSSLFPGGTDTLNTFGIWDWCDPKAQDVELAALEGRHWMLTPRKVVQLTHAVQQPFAHHPDLPGAPQVPDGRGLEVRRRAGDTFATLFGAIRIHAAGTGRIDVAASWREVIDNPAEANWRHEDRRMTAFGFDVGPDEDEARVTMAEPGLAGDDDVVEWKRCVRCQALVARDGGASPCPARIMPDDGSQKTLGPGDKHLLIDAAIYGLRGASSVPSGPSWRRCILCSSLFADTGTAWPCPFGDQHAAPPLSTVLYEVSSSSAATGEGNWRQCKKCGVLYNGSAKPWPCPAQGPHEPESPSYVLPRIDRVSKHEFGDTKHRTVLYHSIATTRFREFLPPAITDHTSELQRVEPHSGRDAVPLTHIVPSSARPLAPEIEYIVPTFRWEDRSKPDVLATSRMGRGVRVYLRRPWFSSGDGELLAVLLRAPARLTLPDQPDRPVEDPLASYVTDFGRDPVWEGAAPPADPRVQHFPLAVTARPNDVFELEELDASVLVAPHPVYWDDDAAVWYADIDLDVGDAYFPMIRLALARYQPNSLPGLHLSRVVQTDFIQPVPDRHAWVKLLPGKASLSLSGVIGQNLHAGIPAFDGPSTVRSSPSALVELQEHDPSLGDFGWTTKDQVQLDAHHQDHRGDWRGSISIPAGVLGSGNHRLLFVEHESYPRDLRPDEVLPDFVSPVERRIVYAAAFEL